MIRICHITTVHRATDIRIYEKECRSLASSGYEVHLITLKPGTVSAPVIHHVLGEEPGRMKRFTRGGKKVLEEVQRLKPALCHLHDPELLRLIPALKKMGCKVIYDSHEDFPRQVQHKKWIPSPIRIVLPPVIAAYEGHYLRKTDGIITVSDSIFNRLEKLGKPCVQIRNYPQLEVFSNRIPYASRSNRLVYAGGLMKTRGILELLRVLEPAGLFLDLAGDGATESFMNEMKAEKGWERVTFHGYLDMTKLRTLYAGAMAGVVALYHTPAHINALPVKLFEYMAAGLPVITSDIPSWEKIILDASCGVSVDVHDHSGYVKVLRNLVSDEAGRIRMSENSLRAVQQYSWENEKKKLLQFYQQVLRS